MLATLLIALLPFACQAAGLAGGFQDIVLSNDDPNVMYAVGAINAMYAAKGDNDIRSIVKVTSAQSQVVAGVLYDINLQVSGVGGDENCHVKVWSRVWLSGDDQTQVTDGPHCTAAPAKRQLGGGVPGGFTQADVSSDDVKNALAFAVDSINAQENSMYLRVAQSNIAGHVQQQVVAGMHYKFNDINMIRTDCMKGTTDLSNCQATDDVTTCHFDVFVQAWMDPAYKMENLMCQ